MGQIYLSADIDGDASQFGHDPVNVKAESIHGEDEYNGGKWTPLSEASAGMEEWRGDPVDVDSVFDALNTRHDPGYHFLAKTDLNQEAADKAPIQAIVCLFKVDFKNGPINILGEHREDAFLS